LIFSRFFILPKGGPIVNEIKGVTLSHKQLAEELSATTKEGEGLRKEGVSQDETD